MRGIFAGVRVIDLRHQGRDRVIATWEHDDVLVDPGPESTVDTLLAGLGEGFEPRAILLTHIHFDHAGATGRLLQRWPDVPVFVHERGAKHMIDPERLVSSARRLYGDAFDRLWGEVVPVPEANVTVLTGGETVLEGAYRVEYTPGHASHHVSYLHEETGTAFVGDVAGVRIAPSDVVLAPTPPPDVDIAAWEASLDTVKAWDPQTLALTHFGEGLAVEAQLEGCRAALHAERDLVRELDEDAYVASARDEVSSRTDAATFESYANAVPFEHIWLGLTRWWSKQ
jgi:glyoxylase-like metal-dependent hydrolase (beta-lactamase superfamily II)